MLPWKLRKCQILPVNQNLSSIYFPLAKFQLVSCNPSLAIIWQMTYTQKLPKLCSATLIRFLAWLTRLYAFHLVQCEVQSTDRLFMATQPWAKILTSMLGFERAIWISRRPKRIYGWIEYSATLILSWYFHREHIIFVELATVMRINASFF